MKKNIYILSIHHFFINEKKIISILNKFSKTALILLITYLFFFINIPITADEKTPATSLIILKDGHEYRGILKSITADKIIFLINEEEKIFNKTEVDRIQFHKTNPYDDISTISQIRDQDIQQAWNTSRSLKIGADQQAVILFEKKTIEFKNDHEVVYRLKKGVKILSENGKNLSTGYFYYLKKNSTAGLLYGLTILPNGQITPIDEAAINDEPIYNNLPQYDNLHRIKFGFKEADIGSILFWETEIVKKYDDIMNPFFLEHGLVSQYPVIKSIVEIISPKKLPLTYSFYPGLINLNLPKITKKIKGKSIQYSFLQHNIAAYINDEENYPSDDLIYPKFYLTTRTTWKELANHYYEKYFQQPVSDLIKGFALKITGNEKTTADKINRLYNYINRSIKKADIIMDDFQFIPLDDQQLVTSPSLSVLDKSYLFIRLLQALDINANMFFYRENNKNNTTISGIPSLKQFDSILCRIKGNEQYSYYSFEDENLRAGQWNYLASNAFTLNVSMKNNSLAQLEKKAISDNRYQTEYICNLTEDNTLNVKRTTYINGTGEIAWRGIRFLSKDELDKYMKSRINNLGNDLEIKEYKFINNLDDFEKPVAIEENFMINNFSFSSGTNLKLFHFPGLKYSAGSVSKPARKFPYYLGAISQSIYHLTLSFPQRYQIDYLPEFQNLKQDGISFEYHKKIDQNSINIEIINTYEKDQIPVTQYPQLKEWLEKKAHFTNEWIVLEAKNEK